MLKINNVCRFITVLSFFLSVQSLAANSVCSPKPGWNNVYKTFNFPAKLVIHKDKKVGDTLYKTEYVLAPYDVQIGDCPGPGRWHYNLSYFNKSMSPIPNVVNTNIPGIGIKVNVDFPKQIRGPLPISGPEYNTPTGAWLYAGSKLTASIIKTDSHVGKGTLTAGNLMAMDVNPNYLALTMTTTATEIITSTCDIIGDKNLILNFGNIFAKKNSPIDTTLASKVMSIPLRCDFGAKVLLTINGEQGYYSNGLKNIEAKNAAKGVEFVLRTPENEGNEPILINKPFLYTSSAKEQQNIDIRFIITTNNVNYSAGKLYSRATYTFNYE